MPGGPVSSTAFFFMSAPCCLVDLWGGAADQREEGTHTYVGEGQGTEHTHAHTHAHKEWESRGHSTARSASFPCSDPSRDRGLGGATKLNHAAGSSAFRRHSTFDYSQPSNSLARRLAGLAAVQVHLFPVLEPLA
jgi:hypothetical protein